MVVLWRGLALALLLTQGCSACLTVIGHMHMHAVLQVFYLSLCIFALALVGAFYPYNRQVPQAAGRRGQALTCSRPQYPSAAGAQSR